MNKFAQTVTDFRGTVEKVLHFCTQARGRRLFVPRGTYGSPNDEPDNAR